VQSIPDGRRRLRPGVGLVRALVDVVGRSRFGGSRCISGRLCGRLVRAADPALTGAQVAAAYRFAFDAGERGGEGALQGTVEGLVVRNCRPSKVCVSFGWRVSM
jgi:hypothetical protein